MMEEEGYGQIIDDWLEEDAKLPRKQRRTNKTMFETLHSVTMDSRDPIAPFARTRKSEDRS